MTKKPCQNNPQFMYTGKESSPRGLGWCAENMTVGERMKGRDGTMWMVSIKNSLHVWTRVPTDVEAPETGAAAATAEAPAAPEPSFAATPAKKKPAPKKKAAAPAAPEPELIPDDLPPLEDTGAVLDDSEPEAEAAPAPEPEPEPAPAPKKKAPAKKKVAPAAAPKPEAPDAEAPEPTPEPAPKKKAAARAPKAAAAPEAEPAPKAAATPKAKRPPTDFALFIKMKVREIKAADPAGRANEALSTAAKAWSALSPDEKAQEIARARAAYEAGELA